MASEPGRQEIGVEETPAQQFRRRLEYQDLNNRQMFGLNPDDVLKLYRRQSEVLKSSFRIGATDKIVENAQFRFVANVNGILRDFGLVVNFAWSANLFVEKVSE